MCRMLAALLELGRKLGLGWLGPERAVQVTAFTVQCAAKGIITAIHNETCWLCIPFANNHRQYHMSTHRNSKRNAAAKETLW